jgi:hypothetical protein
MDRAGGCRTPPDEEGTGVTDVPPEDRDPGSLVGFPAAEKVKQLIKVAYNNDEWTSLYRDPSSGELWKKSHPWPEAHGSGPPKLDPISAARALLEFDVMEEDLRNR